MRVAIGRHREARVLGAARNASTAGHVLSIGDVDAPRATLSVDEIRRRAGRSPVYCADARRRAPHGGRDPARQGRGQFARRIGGGDGHRSLPRHREPRGVGPQARRAPRRRDDEHPQRQGGRRSATGSRRIAHAASTRTTRCRLRRGRVSAAHQPRGRHRGRHDQRRGRRGAPVRQADSRPPRAAPRRSTWPRSKPRESPYVRSDICVVPVLAVIAEAVAAWEMLGAILEKLGGDTIGDTIAARDRVLATIAKRLKA